jgi:hypothetical protein
MSSSDFSTVHLSLLARSLARTKAAAPFKAPLVLAVQALSHLSSTRGLARATHDSIFCDRLTLRVAGASYALKMKVSKSTFSNCLPVIALAVLLSSCAQPIPGKSDYLVGVGPIQPQNIDYKHPAPAIPDDVSYWDGDNALGNPLIKINRAQQKAYFYKGGVLVGISRISSGKEYNGTPPGMHKITQKNQNHFSSAYGVFKSKATGMTINDNVDIRKDKIPAGAVFYNAPMPNFMRITSDGVGMHTGYLPGYAASHGCIRMPHYMSTKFFENVNIGTPVIVE